MFRGQNQVDKLLQDLDHEKSQVKILQEAIDRKEEQNAEQR